jgi:hypothetical protein
MTVHYFDFDLAWQAVEMSVALCERLFKKKLAHVTELVQQGKSAKSVVTDVYGRHLSQHRRRSLERMVSAYAVFLKTSEPVSADELDYKPLGRGRWLRVFGDDLQWLEDFCDDRYGTMENWSQRGIFRLVDALVQTYGEREVMDHLRTHPAPDLANCIAQTLWLTGRARASLAKTLDRLVKALDVSLCLGSAMSNMKNEKCL